MRQPRRLVPGATYHVIARINRREFLLAAPAIKQILIGVMARAKGRFSFELISVCIMDNHIHLMIRPGDSSSLSRIMQWILSVFALRYNRSLGIQGHVWYDRFKSVVIGGLRQFIATFNYIYENPVRAGIVTFREQYRYGPWGLIRHGPPGLIDISSALVRALLSRDQR